MELNREAGFSDDVKSFHGSVVGVDVADLNLGAVLIGHRRGGRSGRVSCEHPVVGMGHGKPVILAGDGDRAVLQVHHGLIRPRWP